jgi:hypothetical protein
VSELETLKEMRVDMGHCLGMLQFIRKDLETIADNLEMLEGIVYCAMKEILTYFFCIL